MQQGFRWLLVLSLLATFIVVTPSAVQAATQTVTTTADSGDGSLRKAILDAIPGDTIDFNITGDGPHTIILTSEQITIDKNLTISGPGAAQLTVARSNVGGTPNFRIFQIATSTTVTIDGLKIKDGNQPWTEVPNPDFPTIPDLVGEAGGGILNNGALTISNSTLEGNTALDGGGIGNHGTLTVEDSTFFINGSSQGAGGGIANWGTLDIAGSEFIGNRAYTGGGVFNDANGTLSVATSSFILNVATYSGGGISNFEEATVSESMFSNNVASLLGGGGLYNIGEMTVTNSTIHNNGAIKGTSTPTMNFDFFVGGGGILNLGESAGVTLTVISSTISSNRSTVGGGINNSGSATLTLTGSIVASNNDGASTPIPSDVHGAVLALGSYNLIGSAAGLTGLTHGINSNQIGPSDAPIDPMIGALLDNGGATFTNALLPGSPAINTGGATCPALDQRGITRPQGSACDIGAFEYEPATIIVTTTADNGPGSLRKAILDANARVDPDIITFASDVTGTITLASALPAIDKDLTIIGPGADVLEISGNNLYRVFEIAAGTTVSLDRLTISNGRSPINQHGGGILNNGTLLMTASAVSSNQTHFGHGGGIRNNGTLTISTATLSNNTAVISEAFAGGVGGGIHNGGTLLISDSTFSGNVAQENGGGIRNFNAGTVTINNSTFSGNGARYGGGIANAGNGTLIVSNSTFTANSTAGYVFGSGGGIWNEDGSTLTLTSTIVAGNSAVSHAPDVAGTINNDGGHNLVGGDPKLGPLQSNGGPTQTHTLLFGSPAIDTGGDTCPATDQRGIARPQGTACDIGAVEVRLPTVNVPDDITEVATSPDSLAVTFTVTATDWDDTSLDVTCIPVSGSPFAPGTETIVTCTTEGAEEQDISASFTVTVNLPAAPTITVPDDMLVEATSPSGADVTFAPSATDWNNAALNVTCDPASGSTFPLGETTVDCSATDAFDRTAEDSFTVTVQDTTAPILSQPANLTVDAIGPTGAVVDYDLPTATEAVDENVTVVCDPPPGSLFPTGTTQVTCSASDAAGNDADPVSFTVTVLGGSQQLSVLISDIRNGQGSTTVKARLLVLPQIADRLLRRGQTRPACSLLNGFATIVQRYGAAQLIPAATAAEWRADAIQIRSTLGCR